MKQIIRLTEEDLHKIVEATVRDILSDTIPDTDDSVYTDSDEFKREFYQKIRRCVNEREYNVLMRVLNGESYDDIGRDYGLSYERIRKIYKNAIERLRSRPDLKDSINNLLTGDYNRDVMNHVNSLNYDDNIGFSEIKDEYLDLIRSAYKASSRFGKILSNDSFERIINMYDVEMSKKGFINFFIKNIRRLFGFPMKIDVAQYRKFLSDFFDKSRFKQRWGEKLRTIKESVNELGTGTPEQLGALAARRKLNGDDASEVHKYAEKHGAKGMRYYLSYIKWLESHPLDMMKRAKKEFHKNK